MTAMGFEKTPNSNLSNSKEDSSFRIKWHFLEPCAVGV
jgi:hypothetical protein